MPATLSSHTDKARTLARRVAMCGDTGEPQKLSVPAVSVIASSTKKTERTGQMAHNSEPEQAAAVPPESTEPVVIDCDDCAVRGPGCRDCVVSVILGVPETLLEDERVALDVLADAGLAPRLRLVPIHRKSPGVA
jgi:hypothetical protein